MAHAIQGHSLDMLDKRGAFRGQGAPSSRLVHSCFRPAPENGHNKPHQIKLYHQGELFQFKANFVRKKIINDMSFSAVWWIIEGMFIWFVSVISANCSRENMRKFLAPAKICTMAKKITCIIYHFIPYFDSSNIYLFVHCIIRSTQCAHP